ncbi:MAG TPA: PmoA family protein [Bryobacteraceae bacterium]|nr:PmoA family protein [Bryobacteraceae bacterium]
MFLLVFALCSLEANVVVSKVDGHLHVEIDGKPFTDFYYGPDTPKPYLHPMRCASGKIVTRSFPMENIPGESTTDQHHRGVWLGYKDVNGADFWQNEFSYQSKSAGKVVTRSVETVKDGIHGTFAWLSPSGEAMLEETRTMIFSGDAKLRTVDVNIELKAVVDTTFGDSKDGAFSVRLAEPLTEKNSGTIVNSEGGRKMDQTWGKPASWVDYSGELDGEKVGVVMFEHPDSFHHPSRWHVRDYGLLAINPFGSNAFDKEAPVSKVVLAVGKSIRLRYRIVIHPEMAAAEIGKLYRAYASGR